MQVSRTEKILIILFFAATWAVLSLNAGGPIFSDEFMYIDAGLRRFAEPSYGNRYFHVHLQSLFMSLAPTPLQGIRCFWGFLIAGSAALIYFNARTFSRESTVLQGLLALAFFFSYPLITEYSGEPAVDITAMAMVALYLCVYLYALNKPTKRKAAMVALGALAFIAFKTKETTIFINFLLVGFLLNEQGRWDWKALKSLIKPLLIGLAMAIGLFILLDGIILGQPFFAISPATFAAVFKNYDFGKGFFFGPTSWYREFFLDDILLAFLLYVASGIKLGADTDARKRLLYIYPLLMAAFVSWNMLKVTFGFIERFYFPALPVVAMLAPQFLRIEWPDSRRKWFLFGLLLVAAGGLMAVLRSGMLAYSSSLNFDFARFMDSIYYPILLSILLVAILFVRKYHWAASVVPLFCIAAMLLSPLTHSYKYFFRYPKVRERYDQLLYPFETFKEELQFDESHQILVSVNLDRSLEMLSEDPNDITGMANFFFDRRIAGENVTMGYSQDGMATAFSKKTFAYALLTQKDWIALSKKADLEAKYQVAVDPDGQIVLLTLK